VSNALLLLVILICTCPFMLLMVGGGTVDGVVAGIAAAGIAVISRAMRPGELQFLMSIIRPAAVLATIPALWLIIQLLPLGAIAHPIWASAEAAIGHPVAGSITVDFGRSIMALGLYLSAVATALLSAAVTVDRRRAEWVLFTLMGATALIAFILLINDLAGLVFPNGARALSERAQAIDCAAIGTIVSVAAAIRTLERYQTRHSNTQRSHAALVWAFAASFTALIACTVALAVGATSATMIAVGYGYGALIAVVIIRRLGLGPWGIAAIAVSAIVGLAVVLIASEPGLGKQDVALAFASPSPPGLTSASQRILDDTAWTGTGAGTFAAIMPIYRDIDEPIVSTAPTAVAALSIELGRPMLWLIMAMLVGTIVVLLRAALRRGRDSFYSAAGAGCLIAILFLSFTNAGVLGSVTAIIAAAVLGLAFAQSKSRTVQ